MAVFTSCWHRDGPHAAHAFLVGIAPALALLLLLLLSGCHAPHPSATTDRPAAAHAAVAGASTSFFSAVVPAPPVAPVLHITTRTSAGTAPGAACLRHPDPQRFDSIECLAGMHVGVTADGQPCRLMVDIANRRMTFQAGTTTVTLGHERLAMSAQGEVIYNLQAIHDASGADGVRLMHMQPGVARPDQTLTQSITLMAASRLSPISWVYAQDGVDPNWRIQCQDSS